MSIYNTTAQSAMRIIMKMGVIANTGVDTIMLKC